MSSFRDLARHFRSLDLKTVGSLTSIAEARGREEVSRRQNPAGLETLRRVAMIQSTEASNAIENIHAPRARIEALVAEKTTPKNRSEQEIAGYRDVLGLIHANQTNIPFEPRYVEQWCAYRLVALALACRDAQQHGAVAWQLGADRAAGRVGGVRPDVAQRVAGGG